MIEMTGRFAGNNLVKMATKDRKIKSQITVAITRETLAELKAATIIFGARSYSSLVHQQVVLKIREARNMVSKEEFERIYDEQFDDIAVRSKAKVLERENSLRVAKESAVTVAGDEVIENFPVKPSRAKKAGKKPEKLMINGGEKLRLVEEED